MSLTYWTNSTILTTYDSLKYFLLSATDVMSLPHVSILFLTLNMKTLQSIVDDRALCLAWLFISSVKFERNCMFPIYWKEKIWLMPHIMLGRFLITSCWKRFSQIIRTYYNFFLISAILTDEFLCFIQKLIIFFLYLNFSFLTVWTASWLYSWFAYIVGTGWLIIYIIYFLTNVLIFIITMFQLLCPPIFFRYLWMQSCVTAAAG